MNKEFGEELAVRTSQVEAIIGKYLPKEEGCQKTVIEAMNYTGRRETTAPPADVGNLPHVRRSVRGD